jgi:hypothetical protein
MFVQMNRTKMSFTRMTSYNLMTINGRPLGKATRFPNGEKGYPVAAGNYILGVIAHHGSTPHQEGVLTAEGVIHMKVNSGTICQVTGTVPNARQVNFWIEDKNTKKRISEVVSVVPENITLATPILIFP